MRILNISSLYPPNVIGGAELCVKTIAEAMADAGHDMHVITLQPPPDSQPTGDVNSGQVTVHQVPLANVYWPFESSRAARSRIQKIFWHGIDTSNKVMVRRVERIVREVKPDVVLTHNLQGFSTAVMPAVKRVRAPLVHVPHDYSLVCPQTALWRNDRGCGFRELRCTNCKVLTVPRHRHLAAVDAVISVSRSLLDFHRLHGLFTDVPATVIHNALRPELKIRTRVATRSDDDVFTFGYLGRVERSKGIETLLAAAGELEARGGRFRLRVAGRADPVYIESLRQRWPLTNIDFVGFTDSNEFLGSIDALVFPSEWLEALGNSVFEAYSQGVPVIGAATGGIPESIDPGVTGFVFEAGNVTELTRAMSSLLDDPPLRTAQGEAALAKARQYLAPRRAAEYVSFLETFLADRAEVAAA